MNRLPEPHKHVFRILDGVDAEFAAEVVNGNVRIELTFGTLSVAGTVDRKTARRIGGALIEASLPVPEQED